MKTVFTGFLFVVILLIGVHPALSYTLAEETAILSVAGKTSFELPELNGMTGGLAARSRSLAVLIAYLEGGDGYREILTLARQRFLPEAALAKSLREGDEACGPNRFFAETKFENAVTEQDCPFFLYDPDAMEYSFGGTLAAGESLEALVRRNDGTMACMRANGTVVFLEERFLSICSPHSPMQVPPPVRPPTAPFQYRKVMEGQALLHMVEADLSKVSLAGAVSPYYDALHPGPERTLYVDELARRAGARVAINGTFFNMKSDHPQYGLPVGSFINEGKMVHNLEFPSLLAFNRCYAAFTSQSRLRFGESVLSGEEIRQRNLDGTFDPEILGTEKIRSFSSGYGWLVKSRNPEAWKSYAGKQFDPSFYSRNSRRARTLLAVDASGRRVLFLAEEEGNASPVPMSLPELAEFLVAKTAYTDVVFLDGGGSTQLAIDGKNVTNPLNSGSYRKNSSALLLMP